MGSYVTVASVRRTSGISSTQISDADVESAIVEVEAQVPREFNTVFTPTQKIEILDGNGTNRILLMGNPLLSVRELKIDGDSTDVADLNVYKESGYIELSTSSSTNVFKDLSNTVVVKYLYGMMENSGTTTTTDTASVAGTSVALSVASAISFSADDWVEVYGMDGHKEVAQVSATDTGEITVDQLVFTHESGSIVELLEVNPIFTKLMNIITSIQLVARVVGESASDIVGYTITEFHVQKGEPYTQWRETATQLIRERDRLMEKVKIRFYIV